MNNIKIKEIENDLFNVEIEGIKKTYHCIKISDSYYTYLTKKKITKKELLEFSISFLLDREKNTSIFASFELGVICDFFNDYEKEVSKWLLNLS